MLELIVNPTAGGGRSMEISNLVCATLEERSIPFHRNVTTCSGHATELARSLAAAGCQTVVAFGGDGTITEVAAGLRGTQTALGIIPCGTGNDFIKAAGIPKDWKEALDFILSHPARPVNSGMANDQFFLNECGTGFDVMTLEFSQALKGRFRGMIPYLYGVLRAITAFRPIEMHLEIGDDVVLDGKYIVCAISNGTHIGGGIPITPGADLTDGMFDILVVDAVPNWKIPLYLPSLLKGTLYKKGNVAHRYLASHCRVCCENMRLNMDGDIRSVSDAQFRCETDSLLLHW